MDKAARKKVEVLYFKGCPNHQQTVELAREIVTELGVDVAVEQVEVRTLEDAARLRFLGSPSVHVDGVDIEAAARASTAYAFACRTYNGSRVPPRELFLGALGGARQSEGEQSLGPRDGDWRRLLPTAAGAAALLLPVGTCPACVPAYAAVLSSLGLPVLLYQRYMLPIAAMLLTASVGSLAYRARSRRGYAPFFVGLVGSTVALIGKVVLASDPVLYVGLSILVAMATWNAWPLPNVSPRSCASCAPQAAEARRT